MNSQIARHLPNTHFSFTEYRLGREHLNTWELEIWSFFSLVDTLFYQLLLRRVKVWVCLQNIKPPLSDAASAGLLTQANSSSAACLQFPFICSASYLFIFYFFVANPAKRHAYMHIMNACIMGSCASVGRAAIQKLLVSSSYMLKSPWTRHSHQDLNST